MLRHPCCACWPCAWKSRDENYMPDVDSDDETKQDSPAPWNPPPLPDDATYADRQRNWLLYMFSHGQLSERTVIRGLVELGFVEEACQRYDALSPEEQENIYPPVVEAVMAFKRNPHG